MVYENSKRKNKYVVDEKALRFKTGIACTVLSDGGNFETIGEGAACYGNTLFGNFYSISGLIWKEKL